MLTQFLELVAAHEYEEDGWSAISSAEWDESALIMLVRISQSSAPEHRFYIACRQPRSYRITAATNHHFVVLTTDHVVLWPHNQKQGELYIKSKPADALSVFGALVESHRNAVGNWLPIDRFLNLPDRSADILRGGHGLLAKGPVSLLDIYTGVLDHYGVNYYTLPLQRDPVWWNGHKWTPETEQLHALVIGDSFVVAPSFTEKVV